MGALYSKCQGKCGKSTSTAITVATREVTSQAQKPPQPAVESRIPSSQRSDTKPGGNGVASSGHRGDEALQEKAQPVVKSTTPLSQKRDTKLVGNAGAISGHRRDEALQVQARPVVKSTTPLSQKRNTPSVGNAGGSSGDREEVIEQPQSVVNSPTPLPPKSDTMSVGNAGGSSGHRRGEASQEQPRSVVEAPIISSQKSYLHSAGNTDGSRVTLQEQSRPGAVSYIRSSQKSDINSGGGASGNSGHNEEILQELPQPIVEPPTPSSQNNDINFGETAGASSGSKERIRKHTNSSNMTNTSGSSGTLQSELQRVLPEHFKFRILVVGKTGSGKSTLINAVFKVNMAAALGTTDINVGFHPEDNYYLVVHEYSVLESQDGGSRNLQTILDFISNRTCSSLEASEKLHAVWICVPVSDDISRRLGDDFKRILSITTVPVILVFTKFDELVTTILRDIDGRDAQHHARAKARAKCEETCRDVFHKALSDVPAGVVSANSSFVDLIDNLIDATDKLMTNPRVNSAQPGVPEAMQRVQFVPLAWSAALRVSHEIIIRTTIAIGRRRYWRTLWNNRDFTNRKLKDCVNVIHFDIVAIWNLNDETRYLSSDRFKIKMSLLVSDLSASVQNEKKEKRARSAKAVSRSGPAGAEDDFADWVNFDYQGSRENVRCMMGYIVDLTVILDDIFRAVAGNMVSQKRAESILGRFQTGRRHEIHKYIRHNVKETYSLRSTAQQDIFLESVDDLIKEHCAP